MHLKYPIYPPPENGEKYMDFDTESEDLKQRAEWGKITLKADSYYIDVRLSSYANYPDSLGVPGTVLFTSADVVYVGLPAADTFLDGVYRADAMALLKNPELTVARIAIACNVAIDLNTLKFVDPDENKPPAEDWQTADAPLGPPLASMPGYYQQNNKVKQPKLGSEWTGPSGRRYRLDEWQQLAWLRITAWKAL